MTSSRRGTAILRHHRVLVSTTAAALVALVVGLAGGRALAPAASSGPPDPGLITAPVVLGELHSEITARADVAYADAVEVGVDTSAIAGPAVVTGQVPTIGTELDAMSVALEVAGRPVIVLPGELAAYRTLRVGVSGPDVVQFKTALRAVGIDGGDPADSTFTEQTADAVTALYAQAGYLPPEGDAGADDAVQSAQAAATAAKQGLAAAENELSRASVGATAAEALAASNAVANAQRELDAAVSASPADPVQAAQLSDALALARAEQDELLAAPDVSAQQLAVDAAREAVAQARSALAEAQQDALPTLPAGEVLFLTALPRRVDAVAAERGVVLAGPAMTVSGASLSVEATVAAADAALLAAGDELYLELPDGTERRAVIAALAPDESDATRWLLHATPDPLDAEQVRQLQGQSVLVRIPVAATDGDVLSVPAAALTSGSGGETRVEVVVGDPRDGERSQTRLAVVRTGLATPDGVEVTPVEAELHEGDLVVVGR